MEFAGSGLLAIAFVSLSSPDQGIRRLAYGTLDKFKNAVEVGNMCISLCLFFYHIKFHFGNTRLFSITQNLFIYFYIVDTFFIPIWRATFLWNNLSRVSENGYVDCSFSLWQFVMLHFRCFGKNKDAKYLSVFL